MLMTVEVAAFQQEMPDPARARRRRVARGDHSQRPLQSTLVTITQGQFKHVVRSLMDAKALFVGLTRRKQPIRDERAVSRSRLPIRERAYAVRERLERLQAVPSPVISVAVEMA